MKVLLVNPNQETKPMPAIPLGLLYVASALRQKGFEVKVCNLCFEKEPKIRLEKDVADFKPDLIGVTLRNIDNYDYPDTVFYQDKWKKIVDDVKAMSNAPIVLGGYCTSYMPEEMLRYYDHTVGICGEGEEAFCQVAEAVKAKAPLDKIPGVAIRERGAFKLNEPCYQKNLDQLLPPALDLVDVKAYLDQKSMLAIQTKRGCPYRCAYCPIPHFEGQKLRMRSPALVVDEIESYIRNYQAQAFYFADNLFNSPLSHAVAICQEIAKRQLPLGWVSYFHVKNLSQEALALFKATGCQAITFHTGTATAIEGTLDLEAIRRVSRWCKEAEFPVLHYLTFGAPWEDLDTLKRLLELMEDIEPALLWVIYKIRLYPRTRLAKETGAKGPMVEPTFYKAPYMDDAAEAYLEQKCTEHPNWFNHVQMEGVF